ncbi:LytTR family DNA-binding domain-containing protein [Flavisolibacter ginsenosidimutans]|uniref:LytTR family transcriptional regulator n=1 Tax=Flavisolibacter ginsenosidimutans TaxID=661481 RepID=A0A5B8UPG9_9BACT|nr:LytTR family transcriptional regulator [Flavisolibacter ginsenosidimutans]
MSSLEEVLPANLLLRIHRSYIISWSKISTFTNHDVENGGIEIPIGRLYAQSKAFTPMKTPIIFAWPKRFPVPLFGVE